jgi:hypothetical protein
MDRRRRRALGRRLPPLRFGRGRDEEPLAEILVTARDEILSPSSLRVSPSRTAFVPIADRSDRAAGAVSAMVERHRPSERRGSHASRCAAVQNLISVQTAPAKPLPPLLGELAVQLGEPVLSAVLQPAAQCIARSVKRRDPILGEGGEVSDNLP